MRITEIEYTDRTADNTLHTTPVYKMYSSFVPRVGDSVEIDDTAYIVNAVICVPQTGVVQVLLR